MTSHDRRIGRKIHRADGVTGTIVSNTGQKLGINWLDGTSASISTAQYDACTIKVADEILTKCKAPPTDNEMMSLIASRLDQIVVGAAGPTFVPRKDRVADVRLALVMTEHLAMGGRPDYTAADLAMIYERLQMAPPTDTSHLTEADKASILARLKMTPNVTSMKRTFGDAVADQVAASLKSGRLATR